MSCSPSRAGRTVRTLADWPRSSYRATSGEEPALDWLETRIVLVAFGGTELDAVAHSARFVAEGKGQPALWEQLKNQVFLGSDNFLASMRRQLPKNRGLREVPQAKRRPPPKPQPSMRATTPSATRRSSPVIAAEAIRFGTSQTSTDYTTRASARSFWRQISPDAWQRGKLRTLLDPGRCFAARLDTTAGASRRLRCARECRHRNDVTQGDGDGC